MCVCVCVYMFAPTFTTCLQPDEITQRSSHSVPVGSHPYYVNVHERLVNLVINIEQKHGHKARKYPKETIPTFSFTMIRTQYWKQYHFYKTPEKFPQIAKNSQKPICTFAE